MLRKKINQITADKIQVFAILKKDANKVKVSLETKWTPEKEDIKNKDIRLLEFGEIKQEKDIFKVGLGKSSEFSREKLRKIAAYVTKKMQNEKIKEFTADIINSKVKEDCSVIEKAQTITEGMILSLYNFDKYKTDKKDPEKLEDKVHIKAFIVASNDKELLEVRKGIEKGTAIAKNLCYVRNLINEPPAVMTPTVLGEQAKKLANRNTKVLVLCKKEMQKQGMNCVLAVSSGSSQEPKFIVIDYNPKNNKSDNVNKNNSSKPIILVGKGITYDSGGLSIKPANYMENMKTDMSGAAIVIGTIKTVIELDMNKRVVGIIPTCENLIGPDSFKVDDIIKAYNGMTIEIKNTDAEGRLILADGLSYAEKNFDAKYIIDIATLTGAATIALGNEITALVGTNEELKQKLLASAKTADEYMWELPIIEEYKGLVKGDISDLVNMAKDPNTPGTIIGGIFLSNFVKKAPFAHLDIGGTGRVSADSAYKKKGGTGVCLRTFVDFIEKN
jgi:leucyl aminopeptidase